MIRGKSPDSSLADPLEAPPHPRSFDVIVVGSGVAGLSAALELGRLTPDYHIAILTRGSTGSHGASPLAQGGVAAALDPSDSPELHAHDTEMAADGLARSELVEILTRDGPDRVQELAELGARFDRGESGGLSLGLEGAHSRRRILHARGDRTGAEVMRALREAVLSSPRIQVFEHLEAVDLHLEGEVVRGVLTRDSQGHLRIFDASATLLTTGGPGRVYLRTTAPPGLDGGGLAMAARAGATLRDLEFVQFHPTALDVDTDPLPLVTEALRGAGARLVDETGRAIHDSAAGGDLAVRDRGARAIWRRIREGRRVFLDCRESPGEAIPVDFPGVYALCLRHGVDPVREPIPVTPAAHYHMGGIAVDAEGRSSLTGLWAAGEVAASGVHGANRLASNSLLEGLVFGPRAARSIASALAARSDAPSRRAPGSGSPVPSSPAAFDTAHATPPPDVIQRIRVLMWERVGIVRNGADLAGAVRELDAIETSFAFRTAPHARNVLLTARLIAHAALAREESLGSHFRDDFPGRSSGRPRHSALALSRSVPGRIRTSMDDDGSLRPLPSRGVG